MPPPGDPCSSNSDSDEDHYYLHEPQFVIHAVDDDDRRRQPAAPTVWELVDAHRDAARRERLRFSLIVPQEILCSCIVILGIAMICLANNREMQTNPVVWVVPCSALVMLFSVISVVLSYRAVYY
ncbi:unnamed protein product [Urochloa humidicola]